jgi:hypothetical protein
MSGSGRSTSNEPLVVSWEARKTADMIRTINEHYRAAKLLCLSPERETETIVAACKTESDVRKGAIARPITAPKG